MADEKNAETIAEITKSYEQKIVDLQKQHDLEIKAVKENAEKEKQKALEEQKAEHNKEIADIILGRKEISEIQEGQRETEKSFFDKAVEDTKKKLKEV